MSTTTTPPSVAFQVDEDDNGSFTFEGMDAGEVAKKVNRVILPVWLLDASGSMSGYESVASALLTGSVEEMRAKGVHEGAYFSAFHFSSSFTDGLDQVIPFMGIDDVDLAKVRTLTASGGTPLYEAVYNALQAINAYGKKLDEEGITTDAFLAIATDGFPEGYQKRVAAEVKALIEEIRNSKAEFRLKSIYVGVIGIGDAGNQKVQKKFADDIGADKYFFAGDISKGTIGKMNGWFSSSVHLSQQVGKSQGVPTAGFATE